ncbi:hypothetical protein LCGC14_1935030, partial [marine sediment metagenome]
MTDPLFDAVTDMVANFVHTNIAGATIENLAADPTIIDFDALEELTGDADVNGYIVYKDWSEGTAIELGEDRHEVYFLTGFIMYDSAILNTSATITAIKAEMRRVMNVNNNSVSRTYQRLFQPGSRYNGNHGLGKLDFVIRVVRTDV